MNRRGFFKLLGGAAVAVSAGGIALLEQELWEPIKTIVLPPVGGWVSGRNTLLTCSQIVNEALKVLYREMVFNTTQADMAIAMTKLNHVVNVRRAPRYVMTIENKDWFGNPVKA